MKHRFILVETLIENEKKALLEAGDILIRSIKTGKLYPVKKFNPQNHMKPTAAQIDKYYREKAGIFPTDAAKAKYKKTKPKAKKKMLPPKKKKVVKKKVTPKKKVAKQKTAAEYEKWFKKATAKPKKKSMKSFVPANLDPQTNALSSPPSDADLAEMSDDQQSKLSTSILHSFPRDIYGEVDVDKFTDRMLAVDFELPDNGKKLSIYIGYEKTNSSPTLKKLLGKEGQKPQLKVWYTDAFGKTKTRRFYDTDDLESQLNNDDWADYLEGDWYGDGHDDEERPIPFKDLSKRKNKSSTNALKGLSPAAEKKTAAWRKSRLEHDHGYKVLSNTLRTYDAVLRDLYPSDDNQFGSYSKDNIYVKHGTFYSNKHDFTKDKTWQKAIQIKEKEIDDWRELKKTTKQNEFGEIIEHVDATRKLIHENLTDPFVIREFVGDGFETNSWKLAKMSNIIFGDDPKDDYRYKSQQAEKFDKKSEEDWQRDAETLKKIMAEQQEVLKKMGFVNDDGTVTLVRAIQVSDENVPKYTEENKGIIEADYVGSAADSWTLDYHTANNWDLDSEDNDTRIVVKVRVPLEKVIASSWGLPNTQIMERAEHEVIINSRDLVDVELYPDYIDLERRNWDTDNKGPSPKELKGREDRIMENKQESDEQLNERRKPKSKKVRVSINNKKNINWLRKPKKTKPKK